MPSHYIHVALLLLHGAAPGTPWKYEAWKEITGVKHGLFPEEDELLPSGWSRQDANDVRSYFDQFQRKPEADRVKFATVAKKAENETIPGRGKWRDWVKSKYVSWGIQARIAQVLSDLQLTPLQLLAAEESVGDEDDKEVHQKDLLSSGSYMALALDDVGAALFGEDALDKLGRLRNLLRPGAAALIQRTWENLKKQLKRSKLRLSSLKERAEQAFKDLDRDGNLTRAKINAVIRAVGRWKALAVQLEICEELSDIQMMEDELQELLAGLGRRGPSKRSKGKGKAMTTITEQQLWDFAAKEDVADIFALHDEYFGNEEDRDLGPCRDPDLPVSAPFDYSNLGIEWECKLTSEELAKDLHFTPGSMLPLIFNPFHHSLGITPWDPAHKKRFQTNDGTAGLHLEAIQLHWHQMVGIHVCVSKLFQKEASANPPAGMLIADEVGLGKTMQAIGIIAFLIERALYQDSPKAKIPPILETRPFLGGSKKLPGNRPHLILVPGTLVEQWKQELKVLLRPQAVDIFIYGTGLEAHAAFWAPNGPYHSSQKSPSSRIIIASHAAVQKDYGLIYGNNREPRKPGETALPWDLRKMHGKAQSQISGTIFGQDYLSVTFDEAQNARNIGRKHFSMLRILERSLVRLILTATPLQTSTKDILAMGRLVGISYFFSKEAYQEQKADEADLRRARQEKQVDDCSNGEGDGPVRACQVLISQRLQPKFEGRVLHRTATSLDLNGKPLIDLPPLRKVYLTVALTPREYKLIEAATEDIDLQCATVVNSKNITSSTFYLDHRKGVTYAQEPSEEKLPHFSSLDDWAEKKSTKIDLCAKLCEHILASDDAPPVSIVNGEPYFPPIPPSKEGGSPPQTSKIIIYAEFPSFRPLIQNARPVLLSKKMLLIGKQVFSLYGIKNIWIDGRTSFERRAEVVNRFHSDPDCRVLFFSKVGSVGLNFANANVVILLDQPWSHQDEVQIRGRAHRQPQSREVTCYHLLAINTADVVLSDMARGKQAMLDAFLSTDKAKKLANALGGKAVDEGEGESDGEDAPMEGLSEKRASKKQARAEKNGAKKGSHKKTQGKKRTKSRSAIGIDLENADESPTDQGSVDKGDGEGAQKGSGKELTSQTAADSAAPGNVRKQLEVSGTADGMQVGPPTPVKGHVGGTEVLQQPQEAAGEADIADSSRLAEETASSMDVDPPQQDAADVGSLDVAMKAPEPPSEVDSEQHLATFGDSYSQQGHGLERSRKRLRALSQEEGELGPLITGATVQVQSSTPQEVAGSDAANLAGMHPKKKLKAHSSLPLHRTAPAMHSRSMPQAPMDSVPSTRPAPGPSRAPPTSGLPKKRVKALPAPNNNAIEVLGRPKPTIPVNRLPTAFLPPSQGSSEEELLPLSTLPKAKNPFARKRL